MYITFVNGGEPLFNTFETEAEALEMYHSYIGPDCGGAVVRWDAAKGLATPIIYTAYAYVTDACAAGIPSCQEEYEF